MPKKNRIWSWIFDWSACADEKSVYEFAIYSTSFYSNATNVKCK